MPQVQYELAQRNVGGTRSDNMNTPISGTQRNLLVTSDFPSQFRCFPWDLARTEQGVCWSELLETRLSVEQQQLILRTFLDGFRSGLSAIPLPVMETTSDTSGDIDALLNTRHTARKRFEQLRDEWKNATLYQSSINEICTHFAYQRIIGMGEVALPFIFNELEKDPDHWFWALSAITCCDPVPDECRGHVGAMAEAWLDWARETGRV